MEKKGREESNLPFLHDIMLVIKSRRAHWQNMLGHIKATREGKKFHVRKNRKRKDRDV
jgi:hypothetical protein